MSATRDEQRGEGVRFHEVQRFRQVWVWLLVLGTSVSMGVVFGYGMIKQLAQGQPWGDRPMSDAALAIVGPLAILFAVVFPLVFRAMRLVTRVDGDGLCVRFFPFVRRRIRFDEIAECHARTYRPIREYGGWGIRWGPSGKAYNVSGDRGVQLVLTNGKRLLIGSQRADELAEAILDATECQTRSM